MSNRQLFPACAAILILLHCLGAMSRAQSKSPLSASSARKLIRRLAGSELPSSAVHVARVSSPDGQTVDAVADIETAFRLVKEQGQWRVAEIRTGDNRWEEIGLILRALVIEETQGGGCAEARSIPARSEEPDPDAQLSRCLIAELTGIVLPSDEVRIKSISPLSLPLSNAPSAVVEARVRASFRFLKGVDGKWRVDKIKTGSNRWTDVESLIGGINAQKEARATQDLKTLAAALEDFRSERGFYVVAKTESVLIDHLNPRYLRRVIRVDPWRKPYQYEGTRDAYTLRSDGADGKPDTSDDIVVKKG